MIQRDVVMRSTGTFKPSRRQHSWDGRQVGYMLFIVPGVEILLYEFIYIYRNHEDSIGLGGSHLISWKNLCAFKTQYTITHSRHTFRPWRKVLVCNIFVFSTLQYRNRVQIICSNGIAVIIYAYPSFT